MATEQTTQTGWQRFVAWLKKALMEIEKFLVKLFTFWKRVEKKLDEAGLLPKLEEDAKADLKSEETKTTAKETVATDTKTTSSPAVDVVTIPPATGGSDLTTAGTSEKAK